MLEEHGSNRFKFKRNSLIKRSHPKSFDRTGTHREESTTQLQLTVNGETTHFTSSVMGRTGRVFPEGKLLMRKQSSRPSVYSGGDSEEDEGKSAYCGKNKACCGKSKACDVF